MRKLLTLCCIVGLFGGCAVLPPNFFGGVRTSEYSKLFDGKVICAYVKGWAENPEEQACMCTMRDLVDIDTGDKSFIRMANEMCVPFENVQRHYTNNE